MGGNHTRWAAFFGALPIVVFTWSAAAQNWPSFRGENGSGIGTGSPPVTWNVDTGENVKWKTRIPGLGHSSPIVWGDRMFVTTAVPVDGEASLDTGWLGGTGDSAKDAGEWEWRVFCLDKRTGKVLWDRTAHRGVPKFKRHLKSSHANSTPTTDGKRVVALFGAEGLFAYDMDGKLLWSKDLGPLNAGPVGMPDMQWGYAASPVLHDDKIIVQCDVHGESYWAVFDAADGRELLHVDRGDDPSWCTPSLVTTGERTQVVCNGFKKIAGYDLKTGKELWYLSGGGDVPVPRPVVAGAKVFITNGHGRSPIYAIRAEATGDITPKESGEETPEGMLWYRPNKGSYMPTPIVVNDVLYVAADNGAFTGFEAKTGEQLLRKRLPGGGKATYSASPVSADGRIYVTNEDGQVDVMAASRTFDVLASNQMGEVCMATPAISEGLLLIRGRDHVFCIAK
ncbi:MAG: PQQ-binding-like beta-propeller repeat protein [Phycisphaerae bacterium]|nr:PQQ-binding-like beta-propeller repeat protein [Phycisphaerae bacterium]